MILQRYHDLVERRENDENANKKSIGKKWRDKMPLAAKLLREKKWVGLGNELFVRQHKQHQK